MGVERGWVSWGEEQRAGLNSPVKNGFSVGEFMVLMVTYVSLKTCRLRRVVNIWVTLTKLLPAPHSKMYKWL